MPEAIDLSKRYNGALAPDSLDLRIEPGEVFCLLGANGAGKTTTINLFLNFIELTSGAAMIKGLDVTKEPLESKRYIAYIPEQVTLYKNLSGLENLGYFSALAGHEEYSRDQLLGFFEEVGLRREVADRRADFRTRSESVERVFSIAEQDEWAVGGGADGDARSVPRQGGGHARRNNEARQAGRAVEHERDRARRSREHLS